MVDSKKIDDLLSRGVGEFIDPEGIFRKKLETEPEKIVIKFGVDPNRPDIHLGHAVVLHKLRQFQDLGAKIIFLIGDYTASIGDPTGKTKTRLEIEQKEIEKNMQTYLKQVGIILKQDPKLFSWVRNSDWFTSVTDLKAAPGMKVNLSRGSNMVGVFDGESLLGKALLYEETRMQKTHLKHTQIHSVSLSYLLNTLRRLSHNRLLERDMFQDRLNKGEELFMHEVLYPVLQGLDSHLLAKIYGSCDLEVGGTDQHFNMLMGRQVMNIHKQEPQAVISFKLLEGTDGKEKMSKSLDNYIGITDEPNNMYGKVMSIPDTSILHYFELCTFTTLNEIEKIKKDLESSVTNPRDIKMSLARQIVEIYHGPTKAEEAEKNFIKTFSKGELPETIEEMEGGKPLEVVVTSGAASSTSAARRLFEEGAVTDMTEGKKVTARDELKSGHIYKIGKHKFIKIK
jgi:tyrosyl-tRNA synthetase